MEGLLEILRRVISIAILVALFLGVVYFTNKRLFVPKQDTITLQKADLPLSRCTVDFDYEVFKDAVKNSSWANLDGSTLEANGEENTNAFNERVNRNGMAETLANEYPDLFKWDSKKGEFEMPKSTGYLTIPTWILYEFIENIEDGQ